MYNKHDEMASHHYHSKSLRIFYFETEAEILLFQFMDTTLGVKKIKPENFVTFNKILSLLIFFFF